MTINDKEIKDYIESHYDEMVQLLEKIVNLESGIGQYEGVDEIIAIFKQAFEDLGLTTRIIENETSGNILVGEYTPQDVANDQPIVLSGHMDTVFKPGILTEHAFRYVDETTAQGAGIADMKGGLVIALYTLKALIHLNYRAHPIKMLFIGDEETLHSHSITRQVMLDELAGGVMMLNFEPANEPQHLGVERKGGGVVRINVTGKAAHSGMGATIGRSAIVDLAHKVTQLESLTDIQRGKLINVGTIQGGVSSNTIPGHATAELAVRFPNEAVKKEIFADLDRIIAAPYIQDTKATYSVEGYLDAMEYTPDVQKLAQHFIQTGSECGYGHLEEFRSEGASDASLGVLAGLPTLCSMGIVGQNAHTTEETADLTSLISKTHLAVCGIIAYTE